MTDPIRPSSAHSNVVNLGQQQNTHSAHKAIAPQASWSVAPQPPQRIPPSQSQSPAPHDPDVYQQVVAILSSTANGCLSEIGYVGLCARLSASEQAYAELAKAYKELESSTERYKSDNVRLAQFAVGHQSQRGATSQEREQSDGRVIHALKERLAQQQQELDLLRRQYSVLQQTQNLNSTDSYKILERKYEYVLELLKRHHAPVVVKNQNDKQEVRYMNTQTHTQNLTVSHKVDLTVPSQGNLHVTENDASLPAQLGSAVHPQAMHGRASSVPTLREGIKPEILSVNALSTSVNGGSQASSPTKLSGNTPVNLSLSGREAANSGAAVMGGSGSSSQTPLPAATIPGAQVRSEDTREFTRLITRALNGQPTTQHVRAKAQPESPSLALRTATQPSITVPQMTAAAHDRRGTQPQLQTQSLPPTPTTAVTMQASTSVMMEAHINAWSPQHLSIPISPAFASTSVQSESKKVAQSMRSVAPIAGAARGRVEPPPSSHSPSNVPLDPKKCTQAEIQLYSRISTSQSPASKCATPVQQEHELAPQPQLRSRSHSPTSPVSAPIAVQSVQDSQHMEVDAMKSHLAVPKHGDADVLMDGRTIVVDGEGEEGIEEEEWADLTDDESESKQPVHSCISSIFYDDDNDVRFCQFCNTRIQTLNLSETRPIFSESSMRDLINHAKAEHPPVWESLRKGNHN
ncbi:hypothetical protein EW145_g5105 [Phellinidium pouzarii]|uniref:Uncharacterized protein n=1 Tax=Phellinidium pouzarii TaxID=167371 RepID=A0A4S4L141_9AGAM|nr:hypothetical protein EW145_g5105 [Phellinidium pouzarii]